MGTSTNRRGISPATPLLPDWLDEEEEEDEEDTEENDDSQEESEPEDSEQPGDEETPAEPPVPDDDNPDIPSNRFDASQRGFREAVRTGMPAGLGRVVKNYYRHALGGPRRAAQRMQSSSRAVARFGGILSDIQQQGLAPVLTQYNLAQYTGRPVVEVLSALMEAVCGTSSLLDNAVTKYAYALAVVRIIEENPALDLSSLTGAQVAEMMAVFLEESLVYRLICDVGRALTVATSNPAQALQAEEQLSQIVSGLIRSTIMPELQKATQDKATIERKLARIYRIVIQTILNS
jgi:hypothetical protein